MHHLINVLELMYTTKQRLLLALTCILLCNISVRSQDAMTLVKQVKAKLDKVNDYTAEGRMKTDVAFIKAPTGKVKVLYKKPNKFKLKRDGGISILPRGGVSVNMSSVLTGNNFVAIASGQAVVANTQVTIVKLLPTDDNSDVVLTTLYIDVANLLIKKANTTTRENGTYEMQMNYGKYAGYGLPDQVIFAFNTKDYKIPKGITLEFETGEKPTAAGKLKNKKGRVEITYSAYKINQGIADSEFK